MTEQVLSSLEAAEAILDQGVEVAPDAASEAAFNGRPAEGEEASHTAEVLNPYMVTEKIAGEGERPEWFLGDKYASVEAQAKAYKDLSAKFGEFNGAPEEYNMEKIGETIDVENPVIHKMAEIAKGINMSQTGFEKMMDVVSDYEKQMQPDIKGFMDGLDTNEKANLGVLSQWAKNNFSEDEFAMLSSWVVDKGSLSVLNKVRGMTTEKIIPKHSSAPMRSQAEIQQEISKNYSRYVDDEPYRDRLTNELAEIINTRQ